MRKRKFSAIWMAIIMVVVMLAGCKNVDKKPTKKEDSTTQAQESSTQDISNSQKDETSKKDETKSEDVSTQATKENGEESSSATGESVSSSENENTSEAASSEVATDNSEKVSTSQAESQKETQKETQKQTEKQTEKQTQKETQKQTQKETQKQTMTQVQTEKQTEKQTEATTSPVYVKTITETVTSNAVYKYGITVTYTYVYTYNVYSDGSRKLAKKDDKGASYDLSTFSATDEELRAESESVSANSMAYYNEVLTLVNEIRAQAGVAPLTLDTELCKAATMRAVEMDYSGVFSHTRPNGSTCWTVLSTFNISYGTCGENIAAGYNSPASVVEGWKNSAGHYANMVNPNFTKLGVGRSTDGPGTYGIYWAQLFTN